MSFTEYKVSIIINYFIILIFVEIINIIRIGTTYSLLLSII